jgi:hypothetical protein
MFTSRFTTVPLLDLTMSVFVCLLATANVQALAQKSAAVVTVQSQAKHGLKPAACAPLTAQAECPAEQAPTNSVKFSSGDETMVAAAPQLRETFCALLSKYLSLS